jgi:FHA domain
VSPFALSVLKYSLLVLLYFFIYRAVKSVVVDVAGRRPPRSRQGRAAQTKPVRASRGRPPSSVVVHGPDGKKVGTVRLSGTVSIGRGKTCAIQPDDAYVSQVHARLFGRDGQWFVEDLGSTNGTFVNDRRVASPVQVHAGDVIRVGKTVLELKR